ncbi:MAG: Transcriptional regulator, TraR/DksA family [Candidatus Falkowbacteria bacterium GW2011_GWC2_38_22]|uniref:Transcriptional regulator, TraR/DksA family n=1 Tax=Candidatus Falkowbacteria bacterium GW2011_GWE1_38_31 TaxID=1618638 RepID=A0A0G0MZB0_9BACT|nr:MAG: Transcriptional regulator, TraR/DksA family [Candidatus Falkowbacteria bacterium GW2011_GWF2_38_1205]KKQ61059.1 MAG: Transcriptional regulator, TraR/DksA family [Candidatus Falkowbacteria bacterium GW2011_GWC2_38_22]KKQ63412.1 MAG: Transcriptional regulator, TraR/DksA family [Candidatus Falkowbacteria bacterium GW2011_GWF1_38_22]KKQ65517.1 MAG: Transcriptional regulator, TraR/DksA family [Candidatus Falkowbacteria bacterium GW2011_GWE2_38_254]KKQ70176.1 MAG: Transcriptional regulator, T
MTNENVLTQDDIEQIRKELIARKKQIYRDLDGVGEDKNGKVVFPEFGDKSDENAQEISEFTTNIATDKVLNDTLRDIDSALKRIDDGTYGICKYCHEPIGKKRMQARPVASACVPCKNKLQNQ